jgi:dihydroorotate dehydrogenase (fumarate)
MSNLKTTYMGLHLKSPVVVSACPLSERLDNIVEMEDAGAGAVVLFSLFEEQITREFQEYEKALQHSVHASAEASSYFPPFEDYSIGPVRYLEIIRKAKERVDIPIIASLNGITAEGWIEYGRLIQEAGAGGLEINIYYIPADAGLRGAEVEQVYIDIVSSLKKHLTIPLAVKLNPYFSSMANMTLRLQEAGANGLVLFNRFYQPDFDIELLKVVSTLDLSFANEIRLPLSWIGLLYGRLNISLAATTGVQTAKEVVKYLLAGADIAMTASSLYRHHIAYIHTIHREMMEWMHRHDFNTVDEFRGLLSQKNISNPTAYERAN